MIRRGRQTPTTAVVLPYKKTLSGECIADYEKTGKTCQEWESLIISDIMAVDDDGLWVHASYGLEVPRQNGKGDIIVMREIYALKHEERVLHTAHRTTTSAAAWERLKEALDDLGIKYKESGAIGQQKIRIYDINGRVGKGCVHFRTRSAKGGVGESFDVLIIDEAQEYTDDQNSALQYTIAASPNSQTLFTGTPPTTDSAGTVFMKYRRKLITSGAMNAGWAEWSVSQMTRINDIDAWYETNPSMGITLTERVIQKELLNADETDFNIQRLGLWLSYNQASEISRDEWIALQEHPLPKFKGRLFVGIKFGHDGTNVAMSIAVKTTDGKIFLEAVDCRPVRAGDGWILRWLKDSYISKIVVDGKSGQDIMANDLKNAKMGKYMILPTVNEVIIANTSFMQAVEAKSVTHNGQDSLTQIASNIEKRSIGSGGGFGFRSIKPGAEVALLDSAVLAFWAASVSKEHKKQITNC